MADCLQADQACVFSVVGDHPDDPNLILLRGEDGLLYQLDLRDGRLQIAEYAEVPAPSRKPQAARSAIRAIP